MKIQRLEDFGSSDEQFTMWVTEEVTPQELYELIDYGATIRLCRCDKCRYYTGSNYCMKHPSVCLNEQNG